MVTGPGVRLTGQILSRRTLLGASASATALLMGCSQHQAPSGRVGSTVSVESWRATRRAPYLIGHRGVGDLVPEHTMPSYQAAKAASAGAIEISVVMSSDKVLFCQHDLTMDRTTALRGRASSFPASTLDRTRVVVPRLGPQWNGQESPQLSRFSDVLGALGGSAVLCVEAKDDAAFDPMVDMINRRGLKGSVILKIYAASGRIEQAQRAGFPVFGYLGNEDDTTPKSIARLAARLNPDKDVLVVPALFPSGAIPQSLLSQAVATQVPVWVFPVHRRSEVSYFATAGVEGLVAADMPYLTRTSGLVERDTWADGALPPGELTKDPYDDVYGLQWPGDGVITLDFAHRPSFFLCGDFCPLPFGAQSYTVTFEARYDTLPTDRSTHLSIAFGHQDDRYYVHQGGTTDGYHAILRATGQMSLYEHRKGVSLGRPLGSALAGRPMRAGTWYTMTLKVTPERIFWSRADGGAVQAVDNRFRGGYFHIGRSGTDGPLSLRHLSVVTN